MKSLKYIAFLLLSFSLSIGCNQQEAPKPAHFRVLSMVEYPSSTLTINGKKENKNVHKTLSLAYGKPTTYQLLSPGYYEMILSAKGKDLLKGTFVMGKNGYYTMLATGILPKKWTVNPQTTMYRLKYIFAGEELHSTNKYMPQWFVLRDNYAGSMESAYIRLVNANPYASSLSIKKDAKSLKSGLTYPTESGMIKLMPGHHNLNVIYGNIKLGGKQMEAKPGYIYTAVVGGKQTDAGSVAVTILENSSRTLMQSQ